ncbi:MAG: hypothetical protein H0U90_04635 [Actinobacteria bacterium]|nr:hypothetical protein [Actinomycetota bacterium]
MRRVVLALVLVGGVAAVVFGGWDALIVYAFFAAIAGGLAYGAAIGGGWIEGLSRSRFDRDDRR